MLAGAGPTAAANGVTILTALGVGGGGLIRAVRWLRNRRIKRIEAIAAEPPARKRAPSESSRCCTAVASSPKTTMLPVEEQTILLLRSRIVRTHLLAVVEPLNRDGIDTVAIGADDAKPGVVIAHEEAPYFLVPLPEDVPLGDQVRQMSFSIVGLSFKEDNKWRLSDGQNTLYVSLADREFVDRVDRNLVRFGKGDIIIAETRISQWEGAEGLRTEYTILRVIEHRPGQAQISLPLQ